MFGGWSIIELVQACADGLRRHAAALDLEQSVHGIDALHETQLHVPLAQGLRDAGLSVYPEHPYPGMPDPNRPSRERERCDFAIVPSGYPPPLDPVEVERARRQARATLFAEHAVQEAGTPSEDLFWLEVKSVGQFEIVDGCVRPSPGYASALVSGGADLRKLARDPHIRFGGLLVVLFAQDAAIAEHDLNLAQHRWLDRGFPLRTGERCGFPISDRLGNAWCSLSLTPIPVRLD